MELDSNTAKIRRVDRPDEELILVALKRLRRCPEEVADPPGKMRGGTKRSEYRDHLPKGPQWLSVMYSARNPSGGSISWNDSQWGSCCPTSCQCCQPPLFLVMALGGWRGGTWCLGLDGDCNTERPGRGLPTT